MGNPMLDLLHQYNQSSNSTTTPTGETNQNNSYAGMFRMMNAARNPMAFLANQFSQTQIGQAMNLIKQNGGDAKAAFYNLAKQKGVNPDDILSQLR